MKEEIMDSLSEAIREKTGTECDIEFRKVEKNNGRMRQGILIKKPYQTICPVIYIDSSIERIMRNEISVQDAAEEIFSIYTENQDGGKLAGAVRSLDKEGILKKVVYQVIGKERNTGVLESVPYKELLDLAAVYRVVMDEDGDGMTGFLLTDSLCRRYGIDREELECAAGRNTEARGFRTASVAGIIAEQTGIPEEALGKGAPSMYMITGTAGGNGAAAMLYPDYLDRLARELGNDLYILPSSIHEVLAVPAVTGSPRELRDMVREINAGGDIADDEILSDSVYFYSLKEGVLRVA